MSRLDNYLIDKDRFQGCFDMLAALVSEMFSKNNLESMNDLKTTSNTRLSNILIRTYDNWITNLIDIAQKHDLVNHSLIEPFLVLTNYEIRTTISFQTNEHRTIPISRKISLLGSYNFDQILKSKPATPRALDNYFEILANLQGQISELLTESIQYLKQTLSEIPKSESPKIVNSNKCFEACKLFYSSFKKEISPTTDEKSYGLHYQQDLEISNEISPYLVSFKGIPPEFYMLSYLPKSNNFQ